MKMMHVPAAIWDAVKNGLCPALIGASGCGKTDVIGQIALQQSFTEIDFRLLYRDPVDLHGLPNPAKDGYVEWLKPAELRTKNGEKLLMFFDEFNHATPAMQAMGYQVLLEKRLAGHPLPEGTICVAAMNRVADKGVFNRTPMPLRRRWLEINIEPDIESWSQWAVSDGNVSAAMIAFLRYRPELLYQDSVNDQLAPDPRAWVMVDRLWQNHTVPEDIFHEMVVGKVGPGPAVEYSAYLRMYQDLPNLDNIIMNPDKAPLPPDGQPATMYAVAAGLARKANVSNFGRVLRYIRRMPAEYGILAVKDAIRRDTALTSSKDYIKWTVENQEYFN